VIGTATGFGGDAEGAFLSVDLYNIGGGAPVRVEVTAEVRGVDMEIPATTIATIPAGGSIGVAVRTPALEYRTDPSENPSPDEFRVRGRYLDRRARPVDQAIFDWRHDQLPPLP
jgi:hypothetical protein